MTGQSIMRRFIKKLSEIQAEEKDVQKLGAF